MNGSISERTNMRLLVWSLLVSLTVSYKSYHGHQVLRTTNLDVSSAGQLRAAMLESEIDFWREPAPGLTADILVNRDNMESVQHFLDQLGIGYSVMVEDVQRSELYLSNSDKTNSLLRL